jgi:hypothetical protein
MEISNRQIGQADWPTKVAIKVVNLRERMYGECMVGSWSEIQGLAKGLSSWTHSELSFLLFAGLSMNYLNQKDEWQLLQFI